MRDTGRIRMESKYSYKAFLFSVKYLDGITAPASHSVGPESSAEPPEGRSIVRIIVIDGYYRALLSSLSHPGFL
jgi:hypothetical protein